MPCREVEAPVEIEAGWGVCLVLVAFVEVNCLGGSLDLSREFRQTSQLIEILAFREAALGGLFAGGQQFADRAVAEQLDNVGDRFVKFAVQGAEFEVVGLPQRAAGDSLDRIGGVDDFEQGEFVGVNQQAKPAAFTPLRFYDLGFC